MRLQRIHEAINFKPWFITAEGFSSIKSIFDKHFESKNSLVNVDNSQEMLEDTMGDFVNSRPEMMVDKEDIAHIYICGVLGQKLTAFEKACGNTGYEQITMDIDAALSEGAKGILFYGDTPGGMAVGIHEVATKIASLEIPTALYTDSLLCSAGYYLGCSVDYIVASSDAMVGSIGTILPWVDQSKLWEIRGLSFDAITNTGADLKDSMHGPTLGVNHREFLQEFVDDLADQFHGHVSEMRELDDEVWRAGFYVGMRALDYNLVDDIGGANLAREYLLQ